MNEASKKLIGNMIRRGEAIGDLQDHFKQLGSSWKV